MRHPTAAPFTVRFSSSLQLALCTTCLLCQLLSLPPLPTRPRRCCNEMRYVSVQTLNTVDRASSAWRWKVVRHRDSSQLAALKEATAEALVLLQGHIPG